MTKPTPAEVENRHVPPYPVEKGKVEHPFLCGRLLLLLLLPTSIDAKQLLSILRAWSKTGSLFVLGKAGADYCPPKVGEQG